jgi:PAS domain S-box-containing protein
LARSPITDQEVKELLKHSEERFRTLVDNIPGAVYRCANERQVQGLSLRTMVFLSEAIQDISGYPSSDFINNRVRSFTSIIHPQDRVKVEQAVWESTIARQPYVIEYRIIRADGRIAWVYDKGQGVFDENEAGQPQGLPLQFDGVILDITDRKQTQAELRCTQALLDSVLRESEAHYRRILETASEGIWMFDANSKTTFANDRIAEMLGYTVEEMLGRSLFDFIDEESRMIAASYVERRRQGIPERHDFKFRRKDGSNLWAIVSARPILDTAGQFVGVLRMITDISDRKRAEEALQASHQQVVQILERITDAFFALDHQWRFTYVNSEAARTVHQNQEELIGASFWDVFPEAIGSLVEQQYRQAITKQIPVTFETFFQRLGSWVEVRVYPCEEGLSVFWRDISDKKQAEKALRESEQRFRATFDQAAVGIAHVNLEGQFLRINQKFCSLVGYTHDEMLVRTLQDITHPDDLDADLDFVRQMLSGQIQMYSLEKRYITRRGEIVWVNLTVSLRRRSSGEPKYFILVVQDISDKKHAEEALRHSESELRAKNQELHKTLRQLKQTQAQLIQNEKMVSLGQMVAGIAHEINNPISFIYGNVSYAQQYAYDLLNLVQLYDKHYSDPVPEIQNELSALDLNFLEQDFPKLLHSMQEGANRIREIVLSLRNFSRLDEADLKNVNIHEGIDNSLLILQHRLKEHSYHPEIQVRKEYGLLPLVECYAGPLNQVFMNLLSNAIDALEHQPAPRMITISTSVVMREKGNQETGEQDRELHPITLKPSASPHYIVIRIADNGPGIPEEVKKHIFDPFFTTKPVGVGTGLGLSISHSIVVEKHSGQLACISTPGQGTEFIIELPVQQTQQCSISSSIRRNNEFNSSQG